MINLEFIGSNYIEEPSFVINRPNGSRNFLFLLFHSDIYLAQSGTVEHFAPGSIIIYTPDCPQYYHNPINGIDNDWFHFLSSDFNDFMASINLPFNIPIYISDIGQVHRGILEIEKEHLMKSIGTSEMIDALIRQLLINISRMYHRENVLQSNTSVHALDLRFRQIRSTMISQIEKNWTLESIAHLSGLSRSRFSAIYKEIFNISPKEDLRQERFKLACYLLKNSQQPINEISRKVGYDDIYQFSKYFKKLKGITPSAYRKKAK